MLLRSTLIAAAVALVLLVTVVLPAEYGVDPTRIGRVLGLTEMGEIKMSLAAEAAREDSIAAALVAGGTLGGARAESSTAAGDGQDTTGADSARRDSARRDSAAPTLNSHVTKLVLAPNEGAEVKLSIRKDGRVTYSWATDRGVVNYDTHASTTGIRYHGYGKGTGQASDDGVLVAAFDGMHGWFWRNRGRETVTVTLRTNGEYTDLSRM
jgi:hypothetical protein